MKPGHEKFDRTVTLDRDKKKVPPPPPVDRQEAQDKQAEAMARIPMNTKLEMFIALAQQGKSVGQALRDSGIIAGPQPDDELALEEMYFRRAAAKKGCQVVSDDVFTGYSSDERHEHNKRGDITTTQLYKLTDWLYFVRGLPLKAIAASLQVEPRVIAHIKADLSNDFAKTIRLQSAEGYIADLLRTKDLLRADLMFRKTQVGSAHHSQIIIDKLLWELENKFVDRLQEIGIIDKNLGSVDVHEEWHVEIGAAGQPINTKMKEIPTTLDSTDEDIDAEYSIKSQFGEESATRSAGSDETSRLDSPNVSLDQRLGAVLNQSATITVEPE